ncbi:MAG: hypothetical protein KUF79_17200 [Candidatus Thiodiazotropha sp. (ex Ctena orbiculata)]|nr:hypothetical protein [Candidatus Thiodiazotropha taylori]
MKVKKWLTVNNRGGCRLTKGKPSLDWNEVAIFLEIELPDALFDKPRLEAKITIPDEAAVSGVIDSAVAENVQEAIEQATGLTFSVAVVDPESAP